MYLKRDGIPVGKSTCVFSLKFVVFQLTMCLYFTVGMILRGAYYKAQHPQIFYLTILGIVINAGLMLLVLFVVINKVKTMMFTTRVINFLARIKLIKRPEQALLAATKTLDEFHSSSDYLRHNRGMMLMGLFVQHLGNGRLLLHHLLRVSCPGYAGLQPHQHHLPAILPVPDGFLCSSAGSSPCQRGWVLPVLQHAVPGTQLIYVATLMWRLFTYYTNLLVGGVRPGGQSHQRLQKKDKLPNGTV